MTENISLSTTLRTSFTLPLNNSSLFNRVNLVFGLFVAGGAYCLYNLYQAYQCTQHTSYGLNDSLKLAKCCALYGKAQEKGYQDAQPSLQQCEDMLASITDKNLSNEKEKLLVKLVQHYAKDNPERSYQLAQRLSLSDNIFNAALSLKKECPEFDADKLDALFVRALEAKKQEKPILDLPESLAFARAFSANKHESATNLLIDGYSQAVLQILYKERLPKFRAFCQLAQCHQEIGNLDSVEFLVKTARDQLKLIDAEKIEACLILADTCFSVGDFVTMNAVLTNVLKLIKKDPPLTAKNVYSLAKLRNRIGDNENVNSKFKKFEVKNLISKTHDALNSVKLEQKINRNRAEDCLTLASIYQEELLIGANIKQDLLIMATKDINAIIDSNDILRVTESDEEIDSMISLIMRLSSFYENDPVTKCQVASKICRYYSKEYSSRIRQAEIGCKILKIYNKAGFNESDAFFQHYLSSLRGSNGVGIKIELLIGQLVAFAQYIGEDGHLTREQTKTQLKAAEDLLSKMDPSISHEGTLSQLIEGYSQIEPQKSLELLANYQDKQAKSYAIPAIALPVLMGITHFYPRTGLLLSGAYVVTRWKGLFAV